MYGPYDSARRIAMLETMLLIRAYEERLIEVDRATGAAGTCTSIGLEAAAAGAVGALEARDRIVTHRRSARHLLARGADPGAMIAEVPGRADGYCKGKSGSLHVSARELGVVLTSTIAGAELAVATGVALAQKTGAEDSLPGGIVAVFFGDGAACEGVFHESLDLAVAWRLPLLYVCENSRWQASVHRGETMAIRHIGRCARAHAIDAVTVDGNDVEQVDSAVRLAAAAVRATGRPHFVELETYRLRCHVEPDEQAHVDPAELDARRARDPIARQTTRLLDERVLAPGELASIRDRVATTIDAATEFANASPWPSLDESTTDVFA